MKRFIFHIDLNAFYASAEQIRRPELSGLPVAVGGNRRRGVVTTCSYEAREYGVKSGMNASEALELCPHLIFVESDMEYYKQKSKEFFDFLYSVTKNIQKVSIDEAYLDLTEEVKDFQKPLDLAIKIQNDLLKETGLSASIGVSQNKFLAKMASDMKKPLGITVIREEEIEYMIYPLAIEETHGIGKKTAPVLRSLGINTIGDLVDFQDHHQLKQVLGTNTEKILASIQGEGNNQLETDDGLKSIGNSRTFHENVTEYDEISEMFLKLSKTVSNRLKQNNLVSDNLTITIRTDDFKTITRSKTFLNYLSDSKEIYEEALLLFDQNPVNRPIRLIGISCNNVKNKEDTIEQLDLFGGFS